MPDCTMCGHAVNHYYDHAGIECEAHMTAEEIAALLAQAKASPPNGHGPDRLAPRAMAAARIGAA